MKGGTLYPLLSRLERGGLVAATWRASSQGPDRKYYHLTDEGDAALSTASKEWRVFVEAAAFLIDDGGGSP
jgi:PadR family transcriptional regulator PadR